MMTAEIERPERIVDSLLEGMPQELAGEVHVAKDIGRKVMISCLDPNMDPAAVRKLAPREYEVLLLLSESMTFEAIGADLDLRLNSVKFYMQNIHKKLGVSNRHQAARFIPVDQDILRSVNFHKTNRKNERRQVLGPTQANIFQLIAEGLTADKDIGSVLNVSRVTINEARRKIPKKIGLASGPDGKYRVHLSRIAGALDNMEEFKIMIEEVATTLQPAVADIASKTQEDNKTLYKSVTDQIMKDSKLKAWLRYEHTRPVARTIIKEEVRFYLAHQQAV